MRSDPYQGCNFVIEIEGLLVGGFSECSGLEVETELVDYREGGVNDYIHRFAGGTDPPRSCSGTGSRPPTACGAGTR